MVLSWQWCHMDGTSLTVAIIIACFLYLAFRNPNRRGKWDE